jgi:hypothetical protein
MYALGIKKQVLRLAPFDYQLEEERAATPKSWIKPIVEGDEPLPGRPTVPVFHVRKADVLRTWACEPFSADEKRDLRASTYPSIGDQLDAIWKVLEAASVPLPPEAAEMLKRIKAVKARFPKE